MKTSLKTVMILAIVIVGILSISSVALAADPPAKGGRAANGHDIYVISQDMYYDTFVPVEELVWNGHNDVSFQPLIPGVGSVYGPGDPEHRGGRWWIDVNGSGEIDEGDVFVLCPLLGPARAEPHPSD